MKNIIILLITFILFSCETESNHDYVDIEIPEGLTNEAAIAFLKDDEENLNKVFNALEDGLKDLVEVSKLLEDLDTNSVTIENEKEIKKAVHSLQWSLSKAVYNGLYFLSSEEIKKREIDEIISTLSKGESISFTKSVDHLKLKEKDLEKNFNKYVKELEAISNRMNEKLNQSSETID